MPMVLPFSSTSTTITPDVTIVCPDAVEELLIVRLLINCERLLPFTLPAPQMTIVVQNVLGVMVIGEHEDAVFVAVVAVVVELVGVTVVVLVGVTVVVLAEDDVVVVELVLDDVVVAAPDVVAVPDVVGVTVVVLVGVTVVVPVGVTVVVPVGVTVVVLVGVKVTVAPPPFGLIQATVVVTVMVGAGSMLIVTPSISTNVHPNRQYSKLTRSIGISAGIVQL